MIEQVKEALNDIELAKTMDMFDQALVEKMIMRFKCHTGIIRDLYAEACGLYNQIKEDIVDMETTNYRVYRKDMTQNDAKIEAKFDSIELRKVKVTSLSQRDKGRAMLESLEDLVIQLHIIKKENFNTIKYG